MVRPIISERQLWKKLKNETTSISWTRLENWALFGTPDLLGYTSRGTFFTVELKSTSPLSKCPNLCGSPRTKYLFTLSTKKIPLSLLPVPWIKGLVRLYPGKKILELVDSGLKLEPLACGLGPCARLLEGL